MYRYSTLVQNIGTEKEPAFQATIPAFNNAIVFGDSLKELHQACQDYIEAEIQELKKQGLSIPTPEIDIKASGKILLRIKPELHQKLITQASLHNQSLNKYIEAKLIGA